jgi:hypothetical protein
MEYRPGALNVVVDALSLRGEGTAEMLALSAPQFSVFDDIRREINSDSTLSLLQDTIRGGAKPVPVVRGRRAHPFQRAGVRGGDVQRHPRARPRS